MKTTSLDMVIQRRLFGAIMVLAFLCAPAVSASAQQSQPAPQNQASTPQATSQAQPPPGGRENLGPTADSIRPYRPYNRDPFKKSIKPKTPKDKARQVALQLGYPMIEERRSLYRQQVAKAHEAGLAEPEPVSQYLVTELDVTGVFRDERGYGAFVKAQPTGTMLFVRNGTRCFNGEVVRIEGDDSGASRVTFRESYKIEQNGKALTQERMVAKSPGAATGK
ncbi:MAG TPA: hypothetical protein VJZ91_18085 [Blastocatellia bacterium]|nr:hypothetical protein [Blastocatellia bacterium]